MLRLLTASLKHPAFRWKPDALQYRATTCALHTVIQRDDRFSQIAGSDIDHFRSILDEKDIITDPETLQHYNRSVYGAVKSLSSALAQESS